MDTTPLQQAGLTQGEAKVYLSLLKLGDTSSGPIIHSSGVSRSKVYELLERLKDKGLVSETIHGGIRHFRAAEPEKLLDYLERKMQVLQTEKRNLQKILPALVALRSEATDHHEARVYVGYEGVRTFFGELIQKLRPGDRYDAMTFDDASVDRAVIHLLQTFHLKRAELGIPARVLCHKNAKRSQKLLNFSHSGFYQFRITDTLLPAGIAITSDLVATFVWKKNPVVFSLVSKQNARCYKRFFNSIWKLARSQ